ncbi:MAG: 2-succinyl-5-enolpyruvyl-6-hydroxy-3-cyclohexene-1-carboxylic-acid synthase [Aquiluna sp.]
MTPAPATTWSLHFLSTLAKLGVRDVVVSPGSRSQALAFAAYELSRNESFDVDVHVAVDERSAGFLALGLSINTRVPTVLVCTSGSAPTHYLPAIVEAQHSGIPLIVVTADRPQRLIGVGANQTTKQTGMFDHAVCHSDSVELSTELDVRQDAQSRATSLITAALSGAEAGRSGVVHLNVHIDEPLSSTIEPEMVREVVAAEASTPHEPHLEGEIRRAVLDPQPGTLVVAGHGAGAEATHLAEALGAPLIAEVHSGARFGPHVVVAYRELLINPPTSISRVVTVGRPTLSRQVAALLADETLDQVVWQRAEPEPANPTKAARVVDLVEPSRTASSKEIHTWVRPWLMASREITDQQAAELDPPEPRVDLSAGDMKQRSEFARHEMDVYRRPLTRREIAREVWEATWPHDQLVLGASRMIRELDMVAKGKNIPVWANRGLSGIDGTVATARGLSLSRARGGLTGITRVLMGDLTLLHDVGSLLLDGESEAHARVHLIVARDGRGSLFELLEAKSRSSAEAFNRVISTPASVDLESLARAYGWDYRSVKTLGELSEALMESGNHLIIDCDVAESLA